VIRPITIHDLNQLMEIEDECFTEEGGDGWDLESYVEWLSHRTTGGFVYETSPNQIAAAILFDAQPIGRSLEVASIGVRKNWRKHGVGSAMLRAVLGEAAIREMRKVWLIVASDNVAACKLYATHGFKGAEHLPDYYKANRHGLRMEREMERGRDR
jgi:ribosomal-protein-alanine N-acetyltransferase